MSLVRRVLTAPFALALAANIALPSPLSPSATLTNIPLSNFLERPSVFEPPRVIRVIQGPHIGYFFDANRNGKRDEGEDGRLVPYRISEPLPEGVVIGAFIPEQRAWGKKVQVVLRDVYSGIVLLNETLDCSMLSSTNSYGGKPLGVLTFNTGSFKKDISRQRGNIRVFLLEAKEINTHELIGGKRMYSFECIANQEVVGNGFFYIQYSETSEPLQKPR